MKLISINIEVNKHYDKVLNFLKKEKPDVICFQELLERDFERFQKELGFKGIFKAFDYVHTPTYEDIWGLRQGVGIFSNNIIDSGYNFYYGKEENTVKPFEEYLSNDSYKKNSVLLWTGIKTDDGKIFKILTTHLPKTNNGESSPFQLEVLDSLFNVLDTFPEFVICGDMNAPRGNETFTRFAKRYKDNIPSQYETSLDTNLHKVRNMPEEVKRMSKFMVDCLFTTPSYEASNVKLVDGLSDHMAIVADIEKDSV